MKREKVQRFRHRSGAWWAAVTAFVASSAAPTIARAEPSLPPAACATADDETASRESFVAAKKAYDVADYDKAIALYLVAYTKDCKRHGILSILASAYEKAGRTEDAIFVLRAYLARLPTADDRDAVGEKIGNLEKLQRARRPPEVVPTPLPTPRPEPPAAPLLEERKHGIAPWVLVGTGVAAVVVGAIVFPIGLASNDGVVATDERGNPKLEGNEPVVQRCGTFGGECRAYVGGVVSDDPRYAVPDRAAKERTHPATQAALAARDTAVTGLVVGGVGLFALGVGLVWHYTEPTGLFARRALTALGAVHPMIGAGAVGGGVGATF